MKEIIEKEVREIKKYQTSDGEIFENKERAEIREKYLKYKEKVSRLKYIDGAYYCKTQEDFDNIVDMESHKCPRYDLNSSRYKPNLNYRKSNFKGPDWYFFCYEYKNNATDSYWVESLSEKKTEWEEFYEQFTI